ncbi:thioredoxin family protein [bacterium]|nr:thioredoxin family protein [bacterium]
MRSSRLVCFLLVAGLAVPGAAGAGLFDSPLNQSADEPPALTVTLRPLSGDLPAGGQVQFGVLYNVPAGTHMTTTFQALEFRGEPAATFGQAVFPPPVKAEIPYYRGDVMAVVPVALPALPGAFTVHVEAAYQLCKEGEAALCFPPAKATTSLVLQVTAATAGANSAAAAGGGSLQDRLRHALEKGSWLAFLMVFLGGVLASLTPCVFPMIPITISFIGMHAGGNPVKGFIMSLWYVLGIALVYSSLGLIAAAGGAAFGQATQTPVFMGAVAAVVFAMALSMAGLYDIQLPSGLTSRIGGGRTGFLGPLLMGMAMGLIAAPCVGPVIVVLLSWVATTGSLFLGFWLLFTFAMGMGLLFIVLGTFGGMLPPGGWMVTVKHVFAIVLYALSLWFLRPWLPAWLPPLVFGLALMLSVSAWGVFNPLPADAGPRAGLNKGVMRFLWIVGLVLALLGGLRGFAPGLLPTGGAAPPTGEASHLEPAWFGDEAAGFAEAAATGKPVMMDFWAEWCAACLELDHKTYNQDAILRLAQSFVAVKMDMTRRSPENDAISRRHKVVGMPTVIFFDSQGHELERFSGFVKAADLSEVMARVLTAVR